MTHLEKYRGMFSKKRVVQLLSTPILAMGIVASSFSQISQPQLNRDIDNRPIISTQSTQLAPNTSQIQALEKIRQNNPNIMATFTQFGATRSITSSLGNITTALNTSKSPQATARSFINSNIDLLGLSTEDLQGIKMTDLVESISGVSHFYYQQTLHGIPVYNGQMQVHVTRAGEISMVNNAFIPNLEKSVKTMIPTINARSAVQEAAKELNINLSTNPEIMQTLSDTQSSVMIAQPDLSPKPFKASLVLVPMSPGNVILAWNFQFQMDKSWPDINIDAETGALITSFDLMKDATFRVYPEPIESPIHTSPLPPNDARVLVVNPENANASPNGWFNTGTNIMIGNNTHACADRNGNNVCDTPEIACSTGQLCDFNLNLSSDPSNSLNAAITNLFYWNNIIHDIQYQYGFDEQGGNFQENNFGLGGLSSDSVNAEAQDNATGGSNCNANFATPTDGSNPRMQMFLCNQGNPPRDGDFDNAVITHEYGHGISTRQVGGPSNSSCLNNAQQGGEGWSDWFGLVYTTTVADRAADARGIGAYLFALPQDGTIRPQRYSTNPAINNYTYESIRGAIIPHGVGSVWAQALWEVYWALVTEHGFEADLVNFNLNDTNEAGNKRALFYVNEGLKNTACSPTFTDARDGIIAAATNSFDGEDVCTVWNAFAAFGLGVNAVSGGSSSTNPTNGFNIPAQCITPPTQPNSVTAVLNGDDITLSWSNVSAAEFYEREVRLNGGDWINRTTYNQPQTSATFLNQQPRTYQYRVRACNSGGCSSWTQSNSLTVLFPAPSSVNATTIGGDSDDIVISWSNVSAASFYERDVSINGGAWTNRAVINQPNTSITFLSQQPRTYQYRVRACNSSNCSDWTISNSITILPSTSSVTATVSGGNDVTISWANVNGATHYNREVSINGGEWTNRSTYNQPQTSVVFANQQPRSYTYRIRACNSNSCSIWRESNQITIN